MRYERRIVRMALGACAPAALTAAALLWLAELPLQVKLIIGGVAAGTTVVMLTILRDRVAYPLRTLSNIVSAYREQDYSLRARASFDGDAMSELMFEINRLGRMLREQRHDAVEADALVRAIVAQLDSAIFVFHGDRLRMINAAGERLLSRTADGAIGRSIDELGLRECFAASIPTVSELHFPGGSGRWSIRRSTFREKGKSHDLLVISDLSRALRDEELAAWQRLVRVLGHELNNSLAPIKSVSESLAAIAAAEPLPEDWREDMTRGLAVIASRADALARFTEAYTRLARMPRPVIAPVALRPLIDRVARGFGSSVIVAGGPDVVVAAEAGQIEQALINLVQNALDASAPAGGDVVVRWSARDTEAEIVIRDEGEGVSNTLNLFVPFFTTKPGGTGIGLVLSRQIAEGHAGSLTLRAPRAGRGCEAVLTLPLTEQATEGRPQGRFTGLGPVNQSS